MARASLLLSPIALGVALASSGCTADDAAAIPAGQVATFDAGGDTHFDTALLEGRYSAVEGCLVVVSTTGDVLVPVFPIGATDPADYVDDGVVSLTGGGHQDQPATAQIPSACAQLGHAYFLVAPPR